MVRVIRLWLPGAPLQEPYGYAHSTHTAHPPAARIAPLRDAKEPTDAPKESTDAENKFLYYPFSLVYTCTNKKNLFIY